MQMQIDYMTRGGVEVSLSFPAKFAVCDSCGGRGGWTYQNAEDDALGEAARSYHQCGHCKGERVVQEIDDHNLTPKQARRLEAVEIFNRDSAETDAMHAAERRAGA